jgi:outer membrane autotransporter protein
LIVGGAGSGAGVMILGGAENELNNYGIITSVLNITSPLFPEVASPVTFFGAEGMAVIGTDGNDVINNHNFMLGSVDLGTGANGFNNLPGAVFWSGSDVKLGDPANTLTNDGIIAPGGPSNVLTTSITGSFVQSAAAVYALDLDLTPNAADRIDATGTATVSGTIPINILNPGMAQTGAHKLTIVHGDGGQTHSNLALSYIPSAVTTYGLSYTTTDVELNYTIDYKPAGLSGNQGSVGNAINQIQSVRNSPAFVPIGAALFYIPTVEALGRAYDNLSGEGTSATQQTAFTAGGMFTQLMMSQISYAISGSFDDVPGKLSYAYAPETIGHPAFAGLKSPAVHAATWRGWFAGFGGQQTVDGEASTGSAGVRQRAGGVAFGFDYRAAPDILVGFAAGGSTSSFQVRDRATSGDVNGAHLGGYAIKTWGPLYFASTLSYSHFDNNTTRTISGIGPTEMAGGKFAADQLATRIELGWKYDFDWFTVTPFAAIQVAKLWQHAYTESSFLQGVATPGILGASFASHDSLSLPTFIGAQIETRTTFANGVVWAPYLRAAWVHEFSPDRTIVPSLISAPGVPFTIDGARAVGDAAKIDAGGKLSVGSAAYLFGNLTGEFSSRGNTVSGTGGLRFAW